jgi:adenosylcobinamide-phosphate synthase
VACTGPAAAAGWAAGRLAGRRPVPGAALAAAATWAVLGGASLAAEAAGISRALTAGDLADARRRLPALCGRDPAGLPAAELARAAVESVAENTCDAVVAPLLWGAAAGVGGLLGYRAVNTLDAMVGHHTMRYERFGWAAARLDDVANVVPARLTAALAVALAPAVGGSGRRALRTVRRDGAAHPSPNAGRSGSASAAPTSTRAWPSDAAPSAMGRHPAPQTSTAPSGCPGSSPSPPRSCARLPRTRSAGLAERGDPGCPKRAALPR